MSMVRSRIPPPCSLARHPDDTAAVEGRRLVCATAPPTTRPARECHVGGAGVAGRWWTVFGCSASIEVLTPTERRTAPSRSVVISSAADADSGEGASDACAYSTTRPDGCRGDGRGGLRAGARLGRG